MATKLKTYMVMAKCNRDVSVEIKAESLGDAVAKAGDLKDEDFVKVIGDYNDGSTIVYGVFES
jgi:hypothetical protein